MGDFFAVLVVLFCFACVLTPIIALAVVGWMWAF